MNDNITLVVLAQCRSKVRYGIHQSKQVSGNLSLIKLVTGQCFLPTESAGLAIDSVSEANSGAYLVFADDRAGQIAILILNNTCIHIHCFFHI